MHSSEAFQMMTQFAEQVIDGHIRKRLFYALNQTKLFQKFKYELDFDLKLRDQWFKFKAKRYEEWVRDYLEVW